MAGAASIRTGSLVDSTTADRVIFLTSSIPWKYDASVPSVKSPGVLLSPRFFHKLHRIFRGISLTNRTFLNNLQTDNSLVRPLGENPRPRNVPPGAQWEAIADGQSFGM